MSGMPLLQHALRSQSATLSRQAIDLDQYRRVVAAESFFVATVSSCSEFAGTVSLCVEFGGRVQEIRANPLLWLLALVPGVLFARWFAPDAHTLLFVLSVLAIVPLAALLSRATENLTELITTLAALYAGQYRLGEGERGGRHRGRSRRAGRSDTVADPRETAVP